MTDVLQPWRKKLNENGYENGDPGDIDWGITDPKLSDLDIRLCELVSSGKIEQEFVDNLVYAIENLE